MNKTSQMKSLFLSTVSLCVLSVASPAFSQSEQTELAALQDGGNAASSSRADSNVLSGSISGTVVDQVGQPVAYATVRILGRNFTSSTDENGRFVLRGLDPGRYDVDVRSVGYATLRESITVGSGSGVRANLVLSTTAGLAMDEVVVYGQITQGQQKALQAQRISPNVVNVVSREKFSLYPDQTLAETLQRIPGVTINRDQGEGEFVQVRGVAEEFNMMQVNGERIPTVEPGASGRSYGLDGFQSYLIETITLSKALTPEMDANAIGATVNLQLREAGSEPEYKFHVAYGLNEQESDFETLGDKIYEVAGVASSRFMDDKFGALVAGSYHKTGRGSLFNSWRYSDEANTDIRRRRTSDYDVTRERIGLLGNFDYTPDDQNSWRLVYNYLRYQDDEVRSQARYNFFNNTEQRFINNREELQQNHFLKFSGEHDFDTYFFDYGLAYIDGSHNSPDTAEPLFSRDNNLIASLSNEEKQALSADSSFGLSDPFVLNYVRLQKNRVDEDHLALTFNGGMRVNEWVEMKAGAKFVGLDRTVRNAQLRAFPTAATPASALVSPEGVFAFQNLRNDSPELAALNLDASANDINVLGPDSNSYDATEDIYAGYLQTAIDVGDFSTVFGVRVEKTNTQFIETATGNIGDGGYTDVIPSIHMKYELSDRTQLRGSFSTGLSRPNYGELVPVENINETAPNEISRGNPDLEATRTENFDAAWEYYTDDLGFYSAGVFLKRITDPVVTRTSVIDINGEEFIITQPENGGSAEVYGLELAATQKFSAFTDAPFLRDLGIDANYTYARSSATFGTGQDDFPLPRSPKHTYNLSLTYDNPDVGLTAVIAASYRDDVFEKIEGGEDIWLGSEFHLDFSTSYQVMDNMSVRLDLNNLTNEPLREIEEQPGTQFSRIHENEFYGVWGKIGVEYSF